MKLKTDSIRMVMLDLESCLTWDGSQTNIWSPNGLATFESYKSLGHDEFIYTVSKLIEGGYINGKLCPANNTIGDIYVYSITWKGHEFLDNIRDPKVWSKTKSITGKFTSVSVSLVSNIASQVIAKIVEDTMHLQ
ncbi:DUF2513 domain-containing protein [Limosilactobacillus sp. c11Ua_112_M]|uniref:DUF2513 domain-containing protein n=1 Tax=Limosilactobacillus portuensis TaxID=2742601 RepID=UPI0017820E23|nr:DUF2513 domain-containing protein [Limosilactobacillus portuensis]MBD8087676.1 DUF2513 domain-containing protein [Limosilactobacillus portuensis]